MKINKENRTITLSWISSLIVGFLFVDCGTFSHLTRGLMVKPWSKNKHSHD